MLALEVRPVHEGVVVSGMQLGRTIGIPTANIDAERFEASNGVYVVEVECLGAAHFGIANLGTRPTVGGRNRQLEVHIFDFEAEIYGESLRVALIAKVRDEVKFDSVGSMKIQIDRDIELAREYLGSNSDA